LLDAILEDLLPQINETVRPLCSVSTIDGDPLFGTIKQSALNLNRYMKENGEWLIPLSLSFSEVLYLFVVYMFIYFINSFIFYYLVKYGWYMECCKHTFNISFPWF